MWTINSNDIRFLWSRINSQWLSEEGVGPNGQLLTAPVADPPDRPVANGLRDVSGIGNNPEAANLYFGAADAQFVRITDASFRDAEGQYVPSAGGAPDPVAFATPTSYSVRDVDLVDAGPRKVSNLVADQSNFAMSVIGYETAAEQTVALLDNPEDRDAPLTGVTNPLPYSSWTTLFGQFFDHGLDFVEKGSDGLVVIPLSSDDPLYVDVSRTNFMIAERTNTPRIEFGEGSTDALVAELFGSDLQGADNATRDPVTTVDLTGTYSGTLVLNGKMIKLDAADAAGVASAINAIEDITGVSATLNGSAITLSVVANESFNTVSPFIDLSQTYGSAASRTVFLKEYDENGVATARLVSGSIDRNGDGRPDSMATWADIKANAQNVGLTLHDYNIGDVPEVEKLEGQDTYGFVALNNVTGEKVLIQDTSLAYLAENNLSLVTTGHAFLNDVARGLLDDMTPEGDVVPDATTTHLMPQYDAEGQATGYVETDVTKAALMDAHFVAGDGRVNENIGLTAIQDIFHSEHNYLVDMIADKLGWTRQEDGNLTPMFTWVDPETGEEQLWNRDGLFEAAKLVNEMEYQHMVFDEFARKISPNVANFAAYDINIDASITAEFAHAVYRFGHSMLTDTVGMTELANGLPTGVDKSVGLIEAFLNPLIYGPETAGEIAYGMSSQVGSGIDVWIVDALRNNLLGLPLDLATLNITRGRDTGIGTLNDVRADLAGAIDDRIAFLDPDGAIIAALQGDDPLDPALDLPNVGQIQLLQEMALDLQPYASWAEFHAVLAHPEMLENLILAYVSADALKAYGTPTDAQLLAAGASDALKAAAGFAEMSEDAKAAYYDTVELRAQARMAIDDPAFMNATDDASAAVQGLNAIDLWVGGLSESPEITGGMLGTTFDFVFATQMMDLQNGDRFYYLDRVGDTDFFAQMIEGQTFSEIVMRNTDARHLYPDIFSVPDAYVEMGQTNPTAWSLAQLTAMTVSSEVIVIDPVTGEVTTDTVELGQAGLVDSTVSFSFFGRTFTFGETVFYGNPGNYVDGRGVLNPNGVGNASEVIGGTDGNDNINALGGNDAVYGDGGNDTIEGGDGNDFLFGGDGDDWIVDTGMIPDPLNPDVMVGSNDIIDGDDGNDFILAGAGFDVVRGGSGNDRIDGGLDGDDIFGGDGDDVIYGGDGGGFAPDVLPGPGGVIPFALEDIIDGGSGNDTIYGGTGWDRVDGGDGNDVLIGGLGGEPIVGARERHDGGEGSDIYLFNSAAEYDPLAEKVDDGGLGLHDVDELRFASETDGETLVLNNQTFGIERIAIGTGMAPDAYYGGTTALNVDATLVTQDLELVGNDGNNVLVGANNEADLFDPITGLPAIDDQANPVLGPQPANWIKGLGGNDSITGGDGADTLEGGSGNDTLVAGGGDDLVDGGFGSDTAVFSGNRSDYAVVFDAENERFIIRDMQDLSSNGTDYVRAVETFRFADEDVAATQMEQPVRASVSSTTLTQNEGTGADTTFTFTVTLSASLVTAATVSWSLTGGLATADDFVGGELPSGEVVLQPGTLTATFDVVVAGDATIETDETFTVTLGAPVLAEGVVEDPMAGLQAAALSENAGAVTATITNDDLSLPPPTEPTETFILNETTNTLWGNDWVNWLTDNSGEGSLLKGFDGRDRLNGNDGNDVLSGGLDQDRLTGGTGEDHFLFDVEPVSLNVISFFGFFPFTRTSSNHDQITDFVAEEDKIVFDSAVFTALSAGALDQDNFALGPVAGDANDFVLYDAASGSLYYDADAQGGDDAVLVANLNGNPDLYVNDFFII
jgi:Ca2+-binding RTX toxin-like protein